eukprot:6880906-Prymnesium_polylepis.1
MTGWCRYKHEGYPRPTGPTLRTASGALVCLSAMLPDECEHCGGALPVDGRLHCGGCGRPCCINEPLTLPSELSGATLQSTASTPSQDLDGSDGAPAAAVPQLIQLSKKPAATRNEWQLMPCPVCGPMCHTSNHFADPLERLATAREKGDAAARKGTWGKALEYYHVCIGALVKSTPAAVVGEVHAEASRAQLKLGGPRSALRHADLAIGACAEHATAHGRRANALEALGQPADAFR